MPKKKGPEENYDPIAVEIARGVGSVGRGAAPLSPVAPVVLPAPSEEEGTRDRGEDGPQGGGDGVVPLRRPARAAQRVPDLPPHHPARPAMTTKRFQLSKEEDNQLTDFVRRLQRASQTKVSLSVVTRAALCVAQEAEEQLISELKKVSPLVQPANNDTLGYADFEQRWARAIAHAVRRSRTQ